MSGLPVSRGVSKIRKRTKVFELYEAEIEIFLSEAELK